MHISTPVLPSSTRPIFRMACPPPLDSNFSIPQVVNHHMQHNPHWPNYVHASADDKLLTISRLEFARACHRIAQSLSSTSNPSGGVIAIIALADPILYHAAIVGCMMAGLVVSLIAQTILMSDD